MKIRLLAARGPYVELISQSAALNLVAAASLVMTESASIQLRRR